MSRVVFTNMCMIYDKQNNKVLIQDRIKNWVGCAFPGGHIEDGESFVDSVIREVKEETGLTVTNVKLCGITHFYNDETKDKYFVFNYKTETFSGDLITDSDEGKNFWVSLNELDNLTFARGFKERLPMYLENKFIESFTVWNENKKGETKWF